MVADVKRRAALPSVQPRFSDANIAKYLDEEMRNVVVPLIMSIVEEFFVTFTDFSVTSTNFSFAIPSAAVGNKLTDVTRLVSGTTQEVQMVQLAPHALQQWFSASALSGAGSDSYILRGNKVIVTPASSSGFTLRMYYYRRPNRLVDVSQAAKITAINTGTGVVTCASVPTSWVTGTVLDAISSNPTFEVLFEGVANLLRAGFDITLPLVNAAQLSVGGYLSAEGEAVIPAQIPVEGHSLIVEAAVMKVAQSLGDSVLMKSSAADYAALKASFLMAIAPRVDRGPKKAVSRGASCWDMI